MRDICLAEICYSQWFRSDISINDAAKKNNSILNFYVCLSISLREYGNMADLQKVGGGAERDQLLCQILILIFQKIDKVS